MAFSNDSHSVATQSTASTKVNEIYRRSKARTPEEELARRIVPKLAARSYHLPGYNLRQDWLQYMLNNHPLLGVCCHHRLHPLKMKQRFIMLLGSFAFGVAITNAIFLWFVGSGRDDKQEVFAVNLSTQQSTSESLSVTSGLLVLVTVGSGFNAIFDRCVWTLSACACCRAGGRFESRGCCKDLGRYLAIFIVIAMVALATCIAVVRASMDEGQSTVPLMQNRTWNSTKQELAQILDFDEFDMQDYSFQFLKGYSLEFVVSLFIYYPLFETVLFSGILGCYRIPIFGGRPYSLRQEAKTHKSGASSVCPSQMA